MQLGESLRGILLGELPIFHVATSTAAQFTADAEKCSDFLARRENSSPSRNGGGELAQRRSVGQREHCWERNQPNLSHGRSAS